jgi:Secretion system C-terminal sorting domain
MMKRNYSIIAITVIIQFNLYAQHSTYYIGHSGFGWDLIVGEMVNDLATDAAMTSYDYNFQFIGGTCLSAQWNNHASPQGGTDSWVELPNGYDIVVLADQIPIQEVIYGSPWGCDLTSVESVTNFYNLALQGNPTPRMYLMEFHNEVDFTGPTPYATWAQLNANMRPLWEQVADSVSLLNPNANVCLIPVASAFQALADSVISGSFPGLTNWNEIFDPNDPPNATIHPTEVTYYLVACVHYACIFGQSPIGLTNETFAAAGWQFDPPTLTQAQMMQEIAWEIVSNDSRVCMSTIGLEEEVSAKFDAYPNPSEGIINLNFDVNNISLQIYDLMGKEINEFDIRQKESVQLDLPKGSYVAVLIGKSSTLRKKIIVL